MKVIGEKLTVRLGGNLYINTPNLVVYRGEPLFALRRLEDGILGIDFTVFGAQGQRIAKFAKSVVVHGDSTNYEIASGHESYSVTERSSGRKIAYVQRRGVDGAELEVNVRMYLPNGFLLDAGPGSTNLGGNTVRGCTFENCGAGIAIN